MLCRYCGAEIYAEHRVCPSCGERVAFMPNEVPAGGWPREAPAATVGATLGMAEGTSAGATTVLDEPAIEAPRTPEDDLFLDPVRIVALHLLSGGLYFMYWLFLTWKQLGRETREQHHPVWHSLTLLVPFYSLCRLHRHVSVINEVARRAGIVPVLLPWIFLVLYIAAGFLFLVASLDTEVSARKLVLHIASMSLMAGLIVWAQSSLNTYWLYTRRDRLSETRFGTGEIVLTVVGALSWLTYLS